MTELTGRLWAIIFALPAIGLGAGIGVGIFILIVATAIKWAGWGG